MKILAEKTLIKEEWVIYTVSANNASVISDPEMHWHLYVHMYLILVNDLAHDVSPGVCVYVLFFSEVL